MNELLIGYVRSVRGLDVEVELSRDVGQMKFSVGGRTYRVGQIGSYVTIPVLFERLVGIVSEVRMQPIEEIIEGKPVLSDKKVMQLQLVGCISEGEFDRGLKDYPLIGDEVHLARSEDIDIIFAGQKTERAIKIGNFAQTEDTPIWIDVNKMLSRHSAIVGNTGSGKSTTVATLIKTFLGKYEHPHIILFDIHGEYGQIKDKKIKHIRGEELKVPHWLLNFSQWKDLLSIGPTASKQSDNLKTAITELREKNNKDFDKAKLSVDTPIYFPMDELLAHESITKDASLSEKLEVLIKDIRCDNIFKSGYDSTEEIGKFAESIIDKHYSCTILDLSKIVPDMLSSVVEILSRLFYEFAYWNLEKDYPIVLIYEEGHRYLSGEYGNYTSRRRVENIAKEGRKYGVGIILVSQRPSEISETIFSQCNNFIIHRLTTDKDREFIKNLLPENLQGLTNLLPSLGQGEALIAGDAAVLPARAKIDMLEKLPSIDCDFHSKWTDGPETGFNVKSILENWIHQKFEWRKK
jgi:hypothetical protein